MVPHITLRRFLLALIALGSTAAIAGVVKWKDANGVVHYGEQAPPGVNSATVRVAPPRPASQMYQPPVKLEVAKPMTIGEEREAYAEAARKRNAEGMAALDQARQNTDARNNQAAIDRCKAARDTYCNQGAAAIRNQEYQHDQRQADAQRDAAFQAGRGVPDSQRIKPTPPCQWPQTCTQKK